MQNLLNNPLLRWFMPNLGIKRWVMMFVLGVMLLSLGFAFGLMQLLGIQDGRLPEFTRNPLFILGMIALGIAGLAYSTNRTIINLLAPYRRQQQGSVIDHVMDFNRRQR